MALLTSELKRVRYELGYNVLSAGAGPFVGYNALFEEVIREYLNAGAKTTSTTVVAAATTPTNVTITLASAEGFSEGDTVVVDIEDVQESATIRAISGSTITVRLSNAHTGPYPVTVEGGESIVRECLKSIAKTRAAMDLPTGPNAALMATAGGLAQVDEIRFHKNSSSSGASAGDAFAKLETQLEHWQDELAIALGVQNLRKLRSCGGGSVSLY